MADIHGLDRSGPCALHELGAESTTHLLDGVWRGAVAPDGDLVLVRADRSVVKGRPETGFVSMVEKLDEPVDRVVPALVRVYLVTAGRVHVIEGDSTRPVMQATGWIAGAAGGNADVLWRANGCELLCTNGDERQHPARAPRHADAREGAAGRSPPKRRRRRLSSSPLP